LKEHLRFVSSLLRLADGELLSFIITNFNELSNGRQDSDEADGTDYSSDRHLEVGDNLVVVVPAVVCFVGGCAFERQEFVVEQVESLGRTAQQVVRNDTTKDGSGESCHSNLEGSAFDPGLGEATLDVSLLNISVDAIPEGEQADRNQEGHRLLDTEAFFLNRIHVNLRFGLVRVSLVILVDVIGIDHYVVFKDCQVRK